MYKWLWNALGWLLLCILLPIVVVYVGLFSLGREIPDVAGMQEAQAVREIKRAWLSPQLVYIHSSDAPAGQVLSQDIRPGLRKLPNTLLLVTVSKGPRMVTVPKLRGMSLSEAGMLLYRVGLQMNRQEAYDGMIPQDQVISQSVEPGCVIPEGRTVTVTVSKGPAPVSCPIFLNDLSEATEVLHEMGSDRDFYSLSEQQDYNTALSRQPKPREVVRRGGTIVVTPGIGYGNVIVPYLNYVLDA